jgi:hypothetical protein
MMLGMLFLAGTALLGACVVRRILRGLLDGAEQLMWGTVVGWTLTSFIIYLLARWQGELSLALITTTTVAVWIITLGLMALELRDRRWSLRSIFVWRAHYAGLVFVLAIFAPIYWRLFSTHMFARGEGGVYSGGSAWYDMSFHAALSASFVYGQNFPPQYTLLAPEPLHYPFLPDFQTAALMAAGSSLRAALMMTSLLLALATTGLFYSFAYRIARTQKAAVAATVLFLLNGGLGFIDFFRDWWKSGRGLIQFWNTLDVNYANYSERGFHWINIIADTLVPQRTSLFGLPLALIIFTIFSIVWRRWHETHESEKDAKNSQPIVSTATNRADWTLLFLAGLLTGLLPIVHTHTYIAVGLVSLVLFAFRPRWIWLVFWAPAVLVAAPHVWPLARLASGGGIVRLLPGWLGSHESFFPLYLLRNFGLPLLLAVPAWLAMPRAWRKFYLAFLLPLVFSFVVVVSPNVFDNVKLTFYWHALNSVLVGSWLVNLATVHRQRIVASLLLVLCVATGLAALQAESHQWQRVFTDEEIAAADYVRRNTAPRALFLTAPVFNQPAISLAGRVSARGPTAWLGSHGYEFREREADVRRIYAGMPDAFDLLRYYRIDYIYFGDAERGELKGDASFFDNNFTVVYRSPTIAVYDARRPRVESVLRVTPVNQAGSRPAPRELASRLDHDPYALITQFPRTSFFVYRLGKSSYGRTPRMNEFMTAMVDMGRGLFVGRSGWEEQLGVNQSVLLNTWTNSREFRDAHDGQTNAEYVNSLLTNAGVDWRASKREDLVKSLDSKAESRQKALLRVVEDQDFYAQEYNTAYVLVHFFGYLRRNPDEAPDRDLSGLNFWRQILDRWGDQRSISRAFLESAEYKNRRPAP